MAHITVVTMGFWGDVMPFVPIARELAGRGHDVTFAVADGFRDVLRDEPFALASTGVDFSPQVLDAHGAVVARARAGVGAARAGRFWVGEFVVRPLDRLYGALWDATEGADLVLTHPTVGLAARLPAEVRGIPWVTGHLFPMMLPSAHQLPAAYPFRRPGRTPDPRHARAAWDAVAKVAGVAMYDRQVNAFRRQLGLEPVRANALLGGLSPTEVMVLVSPAYAPGLPDWPSTWTTTGFTTWSGPPGASLPHGLAEHLDAGDPPVLVTLGTAAASNGDALLTALARTLDRLGARAVFAVGDAARVHPVLRRRSDVWSFTPLAPVLARSRAAIHAGGLSTTAAALSAGVPSVVLPQIFDQAWHGDRVAELGAGVTVPRWSRDVDAVDAAIERVLADDALGAAARALGSKLRTEDGVRTACDHLERHLPAPPRRFDVESMARGAPPARAVGEQVRGAAGGTGGTSG